MTQKVLRQAEDVTSQKLNHNFNLFKFGHDALDILMNRTQTIGVSTVYVATPDIALFSLKMAFISEEIEQGHGSGLQFHVCQNR